jgi:AGZA family xanthine/uracil permease-like MFS transporter
VVLALTPHLAAWGKLQIDSALAAAGTILAAIGACIIDRHFIKAASFALVGSLLTFFGFMHGEAIGIGHHPAVAVGYLLMAALLYGCAQSEKATQPALQPAIADLAD